MFGNKEDSFMKIIIFTAILFMTPLVGYCEEIKTDDLNKDGTIDSWLYRDDKGELVKWIRDSNFDGKEDQWSFFKDGKAFLDEEDTSGDGKVDRIIITVWDGGKSQRTFLITQNDVDKNTFILDEDSGWQP